MFSKGFTLVETIIAGSILTTAVVGLAIAIFSLTVTFSIIPSRLIATYLAQEGMEIIRNIRDTNWLEGRVFTEGLVLCSSGCEADYKTGTPEQETSLRPYSDSYLNIDSSNFYSYSSGSPTEYKRKITIEQIGSDTLKVVVNVYWTARGQSFELESEEHLYNWR